MAREAGDKTAAASRHYYMAHGCRRISGQGQTNKDRISWDRTSLDLTAFHSFGGCYAGLPACLPRLLSTFPQLVRALQQPRKTLPPPACLLFPTCSALPCVSHYHSCLGMVSGAWIVHQVTPVSTSVPFSVLGCIHSCSSMACPALPLPLSPFLTFALPPPLCPTYCFYIPSPLLCPLRSFCGFPYHHLHLPLPLRARLPHHLPFFLPLPYTRHEK